MKEETNGYRAIKKTDENVICLKTEEGDVYLKLIFGKDVVNVIKLN